MIPYNPAISIIMPVFNSERFLEKTIKSVLGQTFHDFELVLIDDGSSDSSPDICDHYRKLDSRVIVIHQKNGGICSARNRGLEIARGEYIGFCDNDDEMSRTCLETAYDKVTSTRADIVRFRRCKQIIDGAQIRKTSNIKNFREKMYLINCWSDFLSCLTEVGYGVWNSLYKKSLLVDNKVLFNTQVKYGYEDHLFNCEACAAAKNILLIPDILYIWKQRVKSSTSTIVSEEAIKNRLEGIELWRQKENEVFRQLDASLDERYTRTFEYLKYVFIELNHSGFDNSEKAQIFKNVKHDYLGAYSRQQHFVDISMKKRVIYSLLNSESIWAYRLASQLVK